MNVVLRINCQLGRRYSWVRCSDNTMLVRDPYEADVNDDPNVWIVACCNCLVERRDEI